MSPMILIALAGIVLGFLCVIVGFMMEGTDARGVTQPMLRRPRAKKRVGNVKKAA
jgi:hypothetical protein